MGRLSLVVGVLISAAPVHGSAGTNKLNAVASVSCSEEAVEISAETAPKFTTFTLSAPNRMVIDVVDAVLTGAETKPTVHHALVTSLKAIAFENAASPVIRIEIGLLEDAEATVSLQGTKLVVRPALTPAGQARVAKQAAAESQEKTRLARAEVAAERERQRVLAMETEKENKARAAQAAKDAALEQQARRQAEAEAKAVAKQAAEKEADEARSAAAEKRRAELAEQAQQAAKRAAELAAREEEKQRERQAAAAEKRKATQAEKDSREAAAQIAQQAASERREVEALAKAKALEERQQANQRVKDEQARRAAEAEAARAARLVALEAKREEAESQKAAEMAARQARQKAESEAREAAQREKQEAQAQRAAEREREAQAKREALEAAKRQEAGRAAAAVALRTSQRGAEQAPAVKASQPVAVAVQTPNLLPTPAQLDTSNSRATAPSSSSGDAAVASKQTERQKLEEAMALTPSPEELRSRTARMTSLGFHQANGTGQVMLRTSSPVQASIGENASGEVVVTLQNCQISIPNNQRMLDASFFDTAVSLVQPKSIEENRVQVSISLKSRVAYRMTQAGNEVTVAFEAP